MSIAEKEKTPVLRCFYCGECESVLMLCIKALQGSSSLLAHVEMMDLIGAGNNPMVGMTGVCAVAIEEAMKA